MKIDFMCLGFPKCGTTTLDMVLRQHTQLSFPKIKETGYWSWYKLYSKPLEELEKYYVFNSKLLLCLLLRLFRNLPVPVL